MIDGKRIIHTQLSIARPDGQTWEDITHALDRLELSLGSIEDIGTGTGADIAVRTLEFTLKNKTGESLAPLDKDSVLNIFNDEWIPLLWPYREVVLRLATVDYGETLQPSDWVTVFEGYLGDSIVTEGYSVSISCRDKSKLLQDTYIDTPKSYEEEVKGEGIPAEELIQMIIDDYVLDAPPLLYCPIPSDMTFEGMDVEYLSVWDAIQNIAKQVGWYLGYRWNGSQYALTFMEPPRGSKTVNYELGYVDDLYAEKLEIGDSEIRNSLTLTYRDKDTGKRVTLSPKDHEELINQDSVDEYRLRAMQIEEGDTSLIDTQEKALHFGSLCIWDLSELSATDRVEMPLFPQLDIFDTFTLENPKTSSEEEFYSVQSIRHTLRYSGTGRFRTEVIATSRVVGARSKWLQMETRPGRPFVPPKPITDVEVPEPDSPEWDDYSFDNNLHLSWHKAEGATGYEVREDLDWGNEEGLIWSGYSHSYSFVPTKRNQTLYVRAMSMLGDYSDDYDTLTIDIPTPSTPSLPSTESFFSAIKISFTPLNNPAILGYYIYVDDEKFNLLAGQDLLYKADSGTQVSIRISAYDVIGEGLKSEAIVATTKFIGEADIPSGVIDGSKLTDSLVDEIDRGIIPKPVDGTLWHFDGSLLSTDGVAPVGLDEAVQENGLIHAPDKLCATLLPDGGVAVEEGTENLVTNPFFQEGKSGWETTFQSGLNFWDVTEGVSWQGGKSLVFEGYGNHLWRGIGQTIGPFAAGESITIQYVHRATGHLAYPLTVRLRGISAQVDSTSLHTRSIGEWMLSSRTFTFLENTGQFQFELLTSSGNAPGTHIYLGGVQVEKKPFATSFVDGTRPDGILSYPVTLPEDYTIAVKRETPEMVLHSAVIRSDGKVFVNGEEDENYEVDWLEVDGDIILDENTGILCYLLSLPRLATPEEIVAWSKRPMFDQAELKYQREKLLLAEESLDDARTRLATAESDLSTVSGTVTNHTQLISQNATAIEARVTTTVFNALEGRVDTAEGSITAMATEIAAKVSQSVFDILAGRVDDAEAELLLMSEAIEARVTKTVYDTLEDRVEEAEGSITLMATEIASKVSQTVFDTLAGTVASQGTAITQNANEIALKASQADLNDLSGEVSSQASEIAVLSDEITLKVQKRDSDGKLIVTGIGVAIDDEGQSEVAIVADRFRLFSSPTDEGEGQAVFAVDTVTKQAYILGDLIADGTIKGSMIDTEDLVAELANIDEAYIDMANIIDLTVENEAGKIKFDSGGLEIDTDDFKLVNGTAWFGGILRAGMVQSTSSVVVASSESSERMKAGADYVCDGEDDDVDINDVIGG